MSSETFATEAAVSLILTTVLNESNSHCYFRYPKHSPTTDINTFNACALHIVYTLSNIIQNQYSIDIN